jgi:5-methylcytosine-specific restriction endonuclease McrA
LKDVKVRCSECGEVFQLYENGIAKNHFVELFYAGARKLQFRDARVVVVCPSCGHSAEKKLDDSYEEVLEKLEKLSSVVVRLSRR